MSTTISIVIASLSLGITAISLLRLYNRDGKGATQNLTRIETKVDYIGGDIKEVRDDVKAQGVRQEDMGERLAKVEESAKSAHHRIDGLEEKNK